MADTEVADESPNEKTKTRATPEVVDSDVVDEQKQHPEEDYTTENDDATSTASSVTTNNTVDSFKIVAAIDFGTTFSGYAYSFSDDEEKIYTNKNWGQTQGFL